jgi:hypothetical protein
MSSIEEMAELHASIPPPYHRVELSSQSSRAKDSQPLYLDTEQAVMPLWDLQIGGRVVRPAVPVGIRLRREGAYFFAENDALSVYASGRTPEEAITEFKSIASAFAEEYRGLAADQVIGLGEKLREMFIRVFPL